MLCCVSQLLLQFILSYSSHSENTTLKKEKKEEMDAIHQYLDEIRNLSSQKEQLAKELEDENKSLKDETAQIRLENDALLSQIQLVTKLTCNEGLQQQLAGKTIEEQVEIFLEERSNCIARLEELQNELQATNDSRSTLQQQLTKIQTSLKKEKENVQAVKQKSTEAEQTNSKSLQDLKKSHEQEKFEILQKYFKINSQEAESKKKIVKLQEEIKCMNEKSAATAKQHQIELQKAKTTAQGQTL